MCESCGVLHGAVPEEGVDRGETHITGGDVVVPVELEGAERNARTAWGLDVVQIQFDDGPAASGLPTKRSNSTRLSR